MPYEKVSDLPTSVRENVPEHAQEIYLEAFNNAWREYESADSRLAGSSREETAHRVAWAAVKKVYKKDEASGKWKPKASKTPA